MQFQSLHALVVLVCAPAPAAAAAALIKKPENLEKVQVDILNCRAILGPSPPLSAVSSWLLTACSMWQRAKLKTIAGSLACER